MITTSTPVSTTSAPRLRRDRIGRVLLWIAAVGAAGAAVSAISTVLGADGTTKVVETWRLYGFVLFAGLFFLLALRPLGYRGVWELAVLNKAALTATALAYAARGGISGTGSIIAWGQRPFPGADRRLRLLPRLDRLVGPGPGPALLGPGGRRGVLVRAQREDRQPPSPMSPQPADRVQVQGAGQPAGALPARGQDHLVVAAAAGFRAHRGQQVLIADQAAGLAADRREVLHGQVHAMLGRGGEVVVWLGRHRELSRPGAEQKLQGGQPGLARAGQGQHHHLARLLLLPGHEVVDRLQVELLVEG
jgi:hypothetical protein